jgi:hypothetical protein
MSRMFAVFAPLVFLVPALAFGDEVAPTAPPPPQPETTEPQAVTPVVTTTPVATPGEAAAPASWYDTVVVGGLVDSYFSAQLRSDDQTSFTSPSILRSFDATNGSFTLAYAELNLSMAPKPVGFRLDLGYGADATALALLDSAAGPGGALTFANVQQAYVSFQVPTLPNLVVDFGRFVTTAGAEVIEAKDNWLYSRSLLFSFAIPASHVGLRATYAATPELTLQLSIVNGWDNTVDQNTAKTFGVSGTYASGNTTGILTWYGGKEADGLDFRNLIDLVVTQKIDDKLTLNLNADVGVEGDNKWFGIAAMGRYQVSKALRLALRAEFFDDPQYYRLAIPGIALEKLSVTEITANAGFPMGDHAELKLEARIDIASEDVYYGQSTQPTLQVAALAWF